MTLQFTPEHQWLRVDDESANLATVGITQHAQDALGDIVFVKCPEVGQQIGMNEIAAVIESVKTVANVFMPGPAPAFAGRKSLPGAAGPGLMAGARRFKARPWAVFFARRSRPNRCCFRYCFDSSKAPETVRWRRFQGG